MADNLLSRYKVNPDKKLIRLAKNELLKGRKLNPYNPHFNVYLSQVLTIQGDHKQALRLLKDALRFNRTHKFNIPKLGLSATQLRRMDQSETHSR